MLKLKLAAELFNHFLRLSPLQSTVQVVLVAFPDANSTDIVPSSVSAAPRTPTRSNFTWHVCSSGASVLRASLADGETWRPWNSSRTSRRARVMRPNFGQNRRVVVIWQQRLTLPGRSRLCQRTPSRRGSSPRRGVTDAGLRKDEAAAAAEARAVTLRRRTVIQNPDVC